MAEGPAPVNFFVSIEGQTHAVRRNPQGIYKVQVAQDLSLAHSAYAAIELTKNSVPFFSENPDCFTVKAYLEDGREVSIPRALEPTIEGSGRFFGRSTDHPDTISLQ